MQERSGRQDARNLNGVLGHQFVHHTLVAPPIHHTLYAVNYAEQKYAKWRLIFFVGSYVDLIGDQNDVQ